MPTEQLEQPNTLQQEQQENIQENAQQEQESQSLEFQKGTIYLFDKDNNPLQQLNMGEEITNNKERLESILKEDFNDLNSGTIPANAHRISYLSQDGEKIENIYTDKVRENMKAEMSKEEQEALDYKFSNQEKIYAKGGIKEDSKEFEEIFNQNLNKQTKDIRKNQDNLEENIENLKKSGKAGKATDELFNHKKTEQIYKDVPKSELHNAKKEVNEMLKNDMSGADKKKALHDLEKEYKNNKQNILENIKNLEKERTQQLAQAVASDDPKEWVKALIAICGTMAGQARLYKKAKMDEKFYQEGYKIIEELYKKLPQSTQELIRKGGEIYSQATGDAHSMKQMLQKSDTLMMYMKNDKNPEELQKYFIKTNKDFPNFKHAHPKTCKAVKDYLKTYEKTKTNTQNTAKTR